LTNVTTDLWAQVAIFQRAGTELPGWMEIALAQHHLIIEALLANDAGSAINALEDHILDMKRRVLADLAPGAGDEETAE
jgi:DNA-binding GntR family transcriptional regulator